MIPDVIRPDYNHAFSRVSRAPARVMIYIKRNVDKLKEHFRVSEHPFGTIKFYDGAYFFLCKEKEKVAAETSLMFTFYNIHRAILLAGGVQNLIRRITTAKTRAGSQGDIYAIMKAMESDNAIIYEIQPASTPKRAIFA